METPAQEAPVYSSIIVPLDGSAAAARALPPAVTLAQEAHVPLVAMTVTTPSFASSTTDRIREQFSPSASKNPTSPSTTSSPSTASATNS